MEQRARHEVARVVKAERGRLRNASAPVVLAVLSGAALAPVVAAVATGSGVAGALVVCQLARSGSMPLNPLGHAAPDSVRRTLGSGDRSDLPRARTQVTPPGTLNVVIAASKTPSGN